MDADPPCMSNLTDALTCRRSRSESMGFFPDSPAPADPVSSCLSTTKGWETSDPTRISQNKKGSVDPEGREELKQEQLALVSYGKVDDEINQEEDEGKDKEALRHEEVPGRRGRGRGKGAWLTRVGGKDNKPRGGRGRGRVEDEDEDEDEVGRANAAIAVAKQTAMQHVNE
eukprot:762556-Hanusia_phi.AAC.8